MRLLADLTELLFPADCPGCGSPGPAMPVCDACAQFLTSVVPRRTRPTPAPTGLPDCAAVGGYRGILRQLILAYKERGRLALADPLGVALALSVLAIAPPGVGLVLVPVPATAAAARARGGDHVRRLARSAARELRCRGRPAVVCRAVAARPWIPDSAELTAEARARRAVNAFRPLPAMSELATSRGRDPTGRERSTMALARGAGAPAVVVVDDIITTGATLAAVTRLLSAADVVVAGAAVLAATRRLRQPRTSEPAAAG